MISSSRRSSNAVSAWPGYVDVLSALLMVVIFMLLIFTVAQFMLSELLYGQESELEALHRRVAELAEMLGLEQEKNSQLGAEVGKLSNLIVALNEDNDMLRSRVQDLSRQAEVDQETLKTQMLNIASLQEDVDALRKLREELESQVGRLAGSLEKSDQQAGLLRDRTKALEARLADADERTLLAQRDLERRDIRIQALAAVIGEQEEALSEERQLSADARAEVMLLNRQIRNLRDQLEAISQALRLAESEKRDQEEQIEDLGRRLNMALAREVGELQRYRSEFFGRLQKILGDNPQIRIEGDRFVLQAELLFASGSARLGEDGRRYLDRLASTLRELSGQIPADIDWILRIDGHTDRIPINTERFPSNWELSTARAVSVVRYLATRGVPEDRMTAAGFSRFHPLDPADTPEAYRKNRRIEFKLTSR
jgi:chemotaxis protein MotB